MSPNVSLDHVTIVTDDFAASQRVYGAVLGALGMTPTVDYRDPEEDADDTGTVAAIGYGCPDRRPAIWLVAGSVPTTGAHLALSVSGPDEVRIAAEIAAAAGARIVQAPRDWESAQLNYYGTQFTDPAGNLIEIVLRAPGRSGLP